MVNQRNKKPRRFGNNIWKQVYRSKGKGLGKRVKWVRR